MRIRICAVGRLRPGPERTLVEDYLARFDKLGRPMGLGPTEVTEVEDRRHGGQAAEAILLAKALPKGEPAVALDERGATLSSPDFAERLAGWRDGGCAKLGILIGGADGLAPELREGADFALSFGPMVWPHLLVRVMLSEQLYRAASILSGTPYHRG